MIIGSPFYIRFRIDKAIIAGLGCLLFDKSGNSRAPTIALAYLMRKTRYMTFSSQQFVFWVSQFQAEFFFLVDVPFWKAFNI
jgi:hypothetical protein